MTSSSSSFPVGTQVWVKMPDYPWWPGVVVDPASIEVDVSARLEGQDACVRCLPSTAPSIMFVSSSNAQEIRPYLGEAADKALIEAGRANAECAPAVEEAVASFGGNVKKEPARSNGSHGGGDDLDEAALNLLLDGEAETAALQKQHAAGGGADAPHSSSDDDEEDEKMLLNLTSVGPGADAAETEEERAERRRQRKLAKKLEKAARKKSEKDKKEKSKTSKKRDRGADASDSDDDGERVDAVSRKMKRRKEAKMDPRDKLQTSLDAYATEAARQPSYPQFQESDLDYYTRALVERRKPVADAELMRHAERVRHLTGECLDAGADVEECEDALLDALRPLSSLNVTYEQLCNTGIGLVVGALLRHGFPMRVQQLADGILGYWFMTLPAEVRGELSADRELDRCSIETTVGQRSEGMDERLGAVGVHIFEAFTDEEIYDAPSNTNVVEICHAIEQLLRDKKNDDHDTRVMVLTALGDPAHSALRRGILEGRFTPQDIVTHAEDPMSLLRETNNRGLSIRTDFTSDGSPTSPQAPYSPTGFGGGAVGPGGGSPSFSSPTGGGLGTFTTLYKCPDCGASEAYRIDYTVQAHDNYPEILRCRKCNGTWNAAE